MVNRDFYREEDVRAELKSHLQLLRAALEKDAQAITSDGLSAASVCALQSMASGFSWALPDLDPVVSSVTPTSGDSRRRE